MAQLTNIDQDVANSGFFKFKSLGGFVVNLIQAAMILGSVIALIFLVWGGIQWISSGGNQEAAKGAKDKITDAIAGLAILALVWVIWRLIVYFLGISPDLKGPFDIKLPQP